MTTSRLQRLSPLSLSLALLLSHPTLASAEVSTDPREPVYFSTLQAGSNDGPDPIDPLGWQSFRQIAPAQILNSTGDLRGDGRPDIAWCSPSGWPVVVWAWNLGVDHDVAFSEWTGTEWSAVTYLTSTSSDDLDPRVFVEADGTIDVVWWTAGAPDAVYLATRAAGSSTWSAPVLVSDAAESARRPSVVVSDGVLRVAYERDSSQTGMAQDVVVRKRQLDGSFVTEIVARTARIERLDAMLHAEQGKLWVDWKQADDQIGYCRAVASLWDAPSTAPWSDASWIGVEDTRRSIRLQVLGP